MARISLPPPPKAHALNTSFAREVPVVARLAALSPVHRLGRPLHPLPPALQHSAISTQLPTDAPPSANQACQRGQADQTGGSADRQQAIENSLRSATSSSHGHTRVAPLCALVDDCPLLLHAPCPTRFERLNTAALDAPLESPGAPVAGKS